MSIRKESNKGEEEFPKSLRWFAELLDEATLYRIPILVVEALDVIPRLRHIARFVEQLQPISYAAKHYFPRVCRCVPRFVYLKIYTPLEKITFEVDFNELKIRSNYERIKDVLDSLKNPQLPFSPHINLPLEDVVETIKRKLEDYHQKKLRRERGESAEEIKIDTVHIYVLTGLLPATEEQKLTFEMFVKKLVYDTYQYLAKTAIYLIFIDVTVPVSTPILQSGCVLYKRIYSTPDEIDEVLTIFKKAWYEKVKAELDESKLAVLRESLAGLPLNAVENILMRLLSKKTLDLTEIANTKAQALSMVIPYLRHVELEFGFESVGGYDPIKELLKRRFIAVMKNPEKAKKYGLRPGRGALFFGPPGTGKTTIAKALAKELGLPTFRISSEVFSSLYGETERNFERMLEALDAAAPDILLLDEVDQFISKRGTVQEHEVTRRLKNMFLEWSARPKRRCIILATTNLIEDLDEAFLRPERVELIVPVPYPDAYSRVEIVKVHLRDVEVPVELDESDLEWVADQTRYWTGDELRDLVVTAKQIAFEEDAEAITREHFEKALELKKVNIEPRKHELEKMRRTVEQYVRDKRLVEMVEKLRDLIETPLSRARREINKLTVEMTKFD
jgi:ATP-dependent 26S proteasome regulatory subunit